MAKVFSFCLYGNKKKYIDGFFKNVEIIQKNFPDFEIHLYKGSDVTSEFPPSIRIFDVNLNNAELMIYRFFVADMENLEVGFVRDADSRIYQRDIWCINEFIHSTKQFHIVRDHFWHKTKITGGLWGMKKNNLEIQKTYHQWKNENQNICGMYDTDQKFLDQCIYEKIKSNVLIHSIIVGHVAEIVTPIPLQLFAENHFIGNVYDFDQDGNEYPVFSFFEFPFFDHIDWLLKRNQHPIISNLCENFDIWRFSSFDRNTFIKHWIEAYYHQHRFHEAQMILSKYQYTHVLENDLIMSNHMIDKIYSSIIATTDLMRKPSDDNEMIIFYGNFPFSHINLPISNVIYRHAYFYPLYNEHQRFEYHPCWDKIKIIYIMNLEERKDRYMDILLELCKMNAPLDRIYHYKASKTTDPYIGATKNHVDVIRHFRQNFKSEDFGLFLEDDFMFTSNTIQHKEDLQLFFQRDYDFDICLLSTSNFHELRPHDDLLNKSFQICTTSSGYILKNGTMEKIQNTIEYGFGKLVETGNSEAYCIDRYWANIQKDEKFFVFRNKMGFQKGNYSSIRSTFTCHFD